MQIDADPEQGPQHRSTRVADPSSFDTDPDQDPAF